MMGTVISAVRRFWPIVRLNLLVLLSTAIASSCATSGKTTDVSPDDLAVHKQLAEYYYRVKKFDKAKPELLLVLKKDPGNADAHFRLGVIYAKEGSKEQSIQEFRKVLSLDAGHAKAYYNLGVLHAAGNSDADVATSIRYFDVFLKLEPDSAHRESIEQWKSKHVN
jgi:Tfp pilus assembly protein PilF